jgi:hypothetical protein
MPTTITIPDGYSLEMGSNGEFKIVPNTNVSNVNRKYTDECENRTNRFYEDLLKLKQKKFTLTREEMSLLEFCDSINVKEFLREEFTKHPLVFDANGNLKKMW